MIAPGLMRWHAAALADAHYGVNALIPHVPRVYGDDVPPLVVIYSAVDKAFYARGRATEEITPDEWVLSVRSAEELDVAANPAERGSLADNCTIVVHLHGVAQNDAVALRYATQIMRCVKRVLYHAFRSLHRRPLVLAMEQQQASVAERMTQIMLPLSEPGDGSIDVALLIPFELTDRWAQTPIPAPPPETDP